MSEPKYTVDIRDYELLEDEVERLRADLVIADGAQHTMKVRVQILQGEVERLLAEVERLQTANRALLDQMSTVAEKRTVELFAQVERLKAESDHWERLFVETCDLLDKHLPVVDAARALAAYWRDPAENPEEYEADQRLIAAVRALDERTGQ